MRARWLDRGVLIVVAMLMMAAVGGAEKQPLLAAAAESGALMKGGQAGPEAAWPGPDGFGYTGQSATYEWLEISSTGTAIAGLTDDGYLGPFPIGFNFSFYGTAYSDFYVASNGYISFGAGSSILTNQCPLPNTTTPNNIIALMWDDLDPGDTGDLVYYQTFATCPIGTGACLVVQYDDFCHYPGGTSCTIAGTWEAILFASSGNVIIQYEDAGAEEGSGSTEGIEGNDFAAGHGLTYACNAAASVTDGTAIEFVCGPCGTPQNIDVDPLSLTSTQVQNVTTQQTLNIGNTGGQDLTWAILEDVSPDMVDWFENFDAYATGSQLHGQGGWKGWGNDPAAGALTSNAQARSAPNSAAIVGASDLVHEYSGYTAGQWTYSAWQYVPTNFSGTTYFILLNTYNDAGSGLNWSVQVSFNGTTNLVTSESVTGGTLPLVKGQWVELRVEIDLGADTQAFYYNGGLLYTGTWTGEVSGGGALNIGAVDLFANASSVVYYDDFSLAAPSIPEVCDSPTDIPWLSTAPSSGTTAGPGTTPVQVSLDSTGLAIGTYNANLCVTSNDPDPGPGNGTDLVVVPVELNVVAGANPSISLNKTVGTTPGVCASMGSITVAAGTTVYYCYTVTNTGDVTFTTHDLIDDQLGSLFTGLAYTLPPGASVNTVDAGVSISYLANFTVTNTGYWTAHDAAGMSAQATDTATVYVGGVNAAIELTKTVGTVPAVCATTDTITVATGTEVYYCYQIENTGDVTLEFHDLVDDQLGTLLDNYPYTLAPGALGPEVIVPETITGPVVNTATWTASAAPFAVTSFEFIDISATGTALNLVDDGEANITLPFPFTLFGVTSSDLRVGNNGGILFGVTTGDLSTANTALPAPMGQAILPFWDDIDSDTGNVYWAVQGSAPSRVAIVEWYNRPHYSNVGSATFEVLLYEGSNAIAFQYLDTDFGDAAYNFGASATVGLNDSASNALQYSFNQAVITNGLALIYDPTTYAVASSTDSATVNTADPDITVTPPSMTSTLLVGTTDTQVLTIGNIGSGTLDWNIDEAAAPTDASHFPPFPNPAGSGDATVAQERASDFPVPKPPEFIPELGEWAAPEAVIYDNGPLVTHPGGGAGGADASALQDVSLGLTIYGFGAQLSAGNRVADDFTVDYAGGWQIDTITFFTYQTGSGTTSTITGLNLQIWDGPPNAGGSVIWGDTTTNIMASTTWSNDYRVLEGTLTNTDRPIMAVVGTVGTVLPPGTYWLDWQFNGTLSSGPWAPPVTILGQTGKPGANAIQYTSTGWAALVDGTYPQDLPFIIDGAASQCMSPEDIPWLSVSPNAGSTAPGATTPVDVTFDATATPIGTYEALLCVFSNDPDEPLVEVPVTMEVVIPVELIGISVE